MISAVLGKDNVSTYNIGSLCDDKGYSRVLIKNKLLNYSSDFNGKIWNNGIFEQLASGEPVEARKLYCDPEMVENYARLAFNTNSMPTSADSSHGFRKRLLLIPFEVKIDKSKADPNLAKKLIKESPGILLWAIEGLQQLIRNGYKLSESETLEQIDEEYKSDTDSVAQFIVTRNYHPDSTNKVSLTDLFNEYMEYCKDNTLKFENKSTFKSRLRDEGYVIEEKNKKAAQVYISKDNPFADLENLPFPAPKSE